MQNHLLQILTLVAMERPVSADGDDIRDEKVKCLKAMPPISIDGMYLIFFLAIIGRRLRVLFLQLVFSAYSLFFLNLTLTCLPPPPSFSAPRRCPRPVRGGRRP
jgi:hypothetical protein